MGATKTSLFSTDHNYMALIFKALGHPARIAIVEHLLKVNACICGELVDVLPLAQPTVSRHLKELKEVGLVQGSVEGNALCYCINPQAIGILHEYFSHISSRLSQQNLICC